MKLYIIHYSHFFHQTTSSFNSGNDTLSESKQNVLRDKQRIQKILARIIALKHSVIILMPYPENAGKAAYKESALHTLQTFVSEAEATHYPVYCYNESNFAEDNFYATLEQIIHDYNNNLEHKAIYDNFEDKKNRLVFLHHDFEFYQDRVLLGYKVIKIEPNNDLHLWVLEKELGLIQFYQDEKAVTQLNQLSAGLLAKENKPEQVQRIEQLIVEMYLRLDLLEAQLAIIKKYKQREHKTVHGFAIPEGLTIGKLQAEYTDSIETIKIKQASLDIFNPELKMTCDKLIENFFDFRLADIPHKKLLTMETLFTDQMTGFKSIIEQSKQNLFKVVNEYKEKFFAAKTRQHEQSKLTILQVINQPNYIEHDALRLACETGDEYKIDTVLYRCNQSEAKNRLEKLNHDGRAPFHLLCRNGFIALVKKYLDLYKLDIELPTEFGYRPLHLAIESGDAELVNLLLESGANINATDKNYCNTPLHSALNARQYEILKLLLQKGATLLPDNEGLNILHLAVEFNDLTAIQIILEQKAEEAIYLKDSAGKTALYQAVLLGNKEAASIFFAAGQWLNLSDRKTLETIAHEKNNLKILGALQIPAQSVNFEPSFFFNPVSEQMVRSVASSTISYNNNRL